MKEFATGMLIGIICLILFGAVTVFGATAEPVIISDEVEFWSMKYGAEYGIQPELIQAIVWTESRCDPTAQSPDKSCKGLMQIKPACHRDRMDRLGARNVFGVWENMKTGTDYLAELRDEEGDIAAALARYNGQSDAKVEKAKRGEYSGYVADILNIAQELERRKDAD